MRTCSVVGFLSLKQGRKPPLFKVTAENKLEWTKIVQTINKQTK